MAVYNTSLIDSYEVLCSIRSLHVREAAAHASDGGEDGDGDQADDGQDGDGDEADVGEDGDGEAAGGGAECRP